MEAARATMEAAVEDARSPASPATLGSLQDAQMTHEAAPGPTSSKLPYDVLLHIFQPLAAAREDSLEGNTATWRITSTATDLLACSLVCRDWTLPAQQVLFQGVRLIKLQRLAGFVETSTSKPDLPQSTRVLSIDPDSFEMLELPGALSPRIVEAVAACSNVHTLQVAMIAPSYAPMLRQVIKSLPLLTTLLFGDIEDPCGNELAHSTYCLADTLQNLPTLRRLEFSLPIGYQHEEQPLSFPPQLTTLALRSTRHKAELHLLHSLGPQLLQFAYTHDETWYKARVSGEKAFTAWSTMLPSLRQLRIEITPANADSSHATESWICALLPRFQQLERFSFSTTLDPLALIPALPLSVEYLEIFARAEGTDDFDELESLRGCIKSIGQGWKVKTLVYDAYGAWWDPVLTGSVRSREPAYVSKAKSVLRKFEKVCRERETRFVKSYPEICPPFFVGC